MADHPNVDRTKKGYEAFGSGDLDTVRSLFAEDITWHVGGSSPLSGDYKGREEVISFFGRLFQETEGTFKLDIHDVLANDTHIVVLQHNTASRKGKSLDQNTVAVYHANEEGNLTEAWFFPEDTAEVDDFYS